MERTFVLKCCEKQHRSWEKGGLKQVMCDVIAALHGL